MTITHPTAGKKLTQAEYEASNAHLVEGFDSTGPITMSGDGLVYLELRPDLDFTRILGQGKPDRVTRGIIDGWSLPTEASYEELFLNCCVPDRWDGESDITVNVDCYLDTANTDKKFRLKLEWEHFTIGDAIPATDNDVIVETDTGTAAQYKSFQVAFTIDYDIDSGDAILVDDQLHLRLERLAATSVEITGEVVITHIGVIYRRNKLGGAV